MIHHHKAALAVMSAALIAMPVAAQTVRDSEVAARYSRTYEQCVQTSGGVTVGMRECSFAEYEVQDRRLNETYRSTMLRLTRGEQTRLRTAQRAWLANRNRDCRNPPEADGGTLDLILIDGCFLDTTISRTIWLERYRG